MPASPGPGRGTPTGATRVRPQSPPFSGRDAAVVVGCAALLVALALLVWVTDRHHDIETVSPPVTTPVVHVPAGATRCQTPPDAPVALTGNRDTSCALASATALRVGADLRAARVDITSPVTGRTLRLTCDGVAPRTCRGDGAVVHLVARAATVVVGP